MLYRNLVSEYVCCNPTQDCEISNQRDSIFPLFCYGGFVVKFVMNLKSLLTFSDTQVSVYL